MKKAKPSSSIIHYSLFIMNYAFSIPTVLQKNGVIIMQLINIGFGNLISASRVIAIVSPDSAPIKRLIQDTRDTGKLIDVTCGRRTRAVIITDSDHIILSAIQPETISGRAGGNADDSADEDAEEE